VPFLALLLWAQIPSFQNLISNPWVGFLVVTGAGYLAGLLLTTLSPLWSVLIGAPVRILLDGSIIGELWKQINAERKKPKSDRIPTLTLLRKLITALLGHASRNDKIATIDKEAGTTLAKMQAEATLCQNLVSAFVILVIVNEKGTFTVLALKDHGIEYRWVIFLTLLATAVFRTVVYLGRQDGLYKLYVTKKEAGPD
jgi:hypothetical protein